MSSTKPIDIDLALQGGGSHGAFTWGVLDRLLEEDGIRIAGVSGASAGAMNATALVAGLASGGREGAQATLRHLWTAIGEAGLLNPLRTTPISQWTGDFSLNSIPGYRAWASFMRVFSPYQLNPFGIDPLRRIVSRIFDFDAVNAYTDTRLFISATNVETGQARLFRQPDISADVLLASACLPFAFKAVEIDGVPYWDGGYTANPPLLPLAVECAGHDIVVVQLNPIARPGTPRTSAEIDTRLNEITFNASLAREIRNVHMAGELQKRGILRRDVMPTIYLHRVAADEEMLRLDDTSELNADMRFLRSLHALGRKTTEEWLAAHHADLGQRSSFAPQFSEQDLLNPALLAPLVDAVGTGNKAN